MAQIKPIFWCLTIVSYTKWLNKQNSNQFAETLSSDKNHSQQLAT